MVDKISPQSRDEYKAECERAISLFQQSLDGYQGSQEPHQKGVYKEVMDKALVIMSETIQSALGKEALKKQQKLEQDYENYIANANPSTLSAVNQDIASLQKTVS